MIKFKFNLIHWKACIFTKIELASSRMSKTLIVQGGGFRTGFAAGVLDAFMALDYYPFDRIVGVSGGAIASSYYLAKQYGACVEAMYWLAKDTEFVKLKHVIQERGYMNIDYLREVAYEFVPFNLEKALVAAEGKKINFVATNRSTGKPEYLQPNSEDWVEVVIASCTLPFITKGVHKVRNLDLMDGAWGDPLPIEWTVNQGADDIVVIRTSHISKKMSKSIPNYLGSLFFKSQKELSDCFAQHHTFYNNSLDFIENAPESLKIRQLWPEDGLKCTGTSYSESSIKTDYRYGLQVGINYVRESLLVNLH